MAKVIYKEGQEGQNRLDCIEGIEIELLNGQKALIYPKYAERALLENERIDDWGAKPMTEIEALKVEDSASATDELLALDSSAAKFVRQFKSDVYGQFNMPTLLAAMEIIYQQEDINALAETIEGAGLLKEDAFVSSCSRCFQLNRWVVNGVNGLTYGFIYNYVSFNPCVCVPTIVYDSVI